MEENITTNSNEGLEQQNEQTEVKTYTQDEVLKLIQAESDKRVTQALKTQQKQFEKKMSLTRLDGEEREKAEKDARIAELEELVSQMNIANNRSELKSVLSSRGLSAEFADIINITDDIEASQANIDKLDRLFKAAVKAEVEKRLAGNTPKGNGNNIAAEITKEQASKLSIAEINDMARNNPEQFKKLFGGN